MNKDIKTVLGADFGYGHSKFSFGTIDGEISKKFKFPTRIGIAKKLDNIDDSKIKEFRGHYYYVGENASHLPSEQLINIEEYKNLEYYAPLLLEHAIEIIGEVPGIITTGLSIAQIQNSGHFQANLQEFEVDKKKYKFDKVFVLPQGAGAKLCIDIYGDNFPTKQTEFLGATTYVGVDIGMNTLDLFLVKDGEAKANLFEGIEKEGIMKIAAKIAKKVHDDHKRQITLTEATDILDTGVYKLRGQKHDFSMYIQDVKLEYLKNILKLVNDKYPGILDKADFISISGGGSTVFKNTKDKFIRVVQNSPEFYNSIGFFLFGLKQA